MADSVFKENWKLSITTIIFWTPSFTNESERRRKFRVCQSWRLISYLLMVFFDGETLKSKVSRTRYPLIFSQKKKAIQNGKAFSYYNFVRSQF
jgi:hypothetical protein